MLSNKLTFSLASLIVLLMVGLCLPVSAQIIQATTVAPLPAPPAFDVDGDATVDPGEAGGFFTPAGFVVYGEGAVADSGVNNAIGFARYVQVPAPGLPDLEAFFRFGGTLALVGDPSLGGDAGDFVISEIMWANDVDNPATAATPNDRRQWIEIFNSQTDAMGSPMVAPDAGAVAAGVAVGATPLAADMLALVFIPYQHVESANVITVANAAGAGIPTDPAFMVYDVMSNMQFGRWGVPGMNGNTTSVAGGGQLDPPVSPLVSAYRDINYTRVGGINNLRGDNTVNTDPNRTWQLGGIPNGYAPGSWIETDPGGRRNTTMDLLVASPGVAHVMGIVYEGAPRTVLPADAAVIITEVRNDTSPANVDWVELHNPGVEPVGLWGWELTIVDDRDDDDDLSDTDMVLVGFDQEYSPQQRLERGFPRNEDFRLGPGEYLLIVNRDPRETVLANGVDVDAAIAGTNVNAGATHQYIIRPMLDLPDTAISLVLRNHVERNARHVEQRKEDRADERVSTNTDPSLNIQDYVGSYRQAVTTNDYNTQVWPFRGWTATSRADGQHPQGIPANTMQAAARLLTGDDSTVYILGAHNDAWDAVGSVGGIGYDPGVDMRNAPGTPGYANNPVRNALVDNRGTFANTADDLMYDGEISISEVMVDAGPRWNLIQWIEIYNSSMTQVVDLAGWELEIRNATDEVESYVDSSFIFNTATILPNQTLLIVSGTGTNDVPDNRVYNLHEHHRRALGLTNRRSVLLSPEGFYLRLRAPVPHSNRGTEWVVIDEAGNVMVDGAKRNVMWELPARDPAMRQSLVRQYGTRELYDGSPDSADDGTMMDSWRQSDLTGAGISFYGHRDDISTPGFRLGGPLPVSLSKFRPVRNLETGHVDITWITESELNNAGFNILRSEAKNGEFKVINVKGIVAGHGTTSEQHVYKFTDTNAKPNVVYYYQIEDVSINGLTDDLDDDALERSCGCGR